MSPWWTLNGDTDMFTGLVEHAGKIISTAPSGDGRRLKLDLGPCARGLKPGDSVAVSGVCLTVAQLSGARAAFDVVQETLSVTTLGLKRPGDRVNIERSLRLGDPLGGHIVQGHVDGIARAAEIRPGKNAWSVQFEAAPEILGQMIEKGSVAVDGVSLTIAGLSAGAFHVALIPTTLEATTLGALKVGDRVNIETDVLGKYVISLVSRMFAKGEAPASGGLEFLGEHG